MFQVRSILEREFNNLLARGTDRQLEEVGLYYFLTFETTLA